MDNQFTSPRLTVRTGNQPQVALFALRSAFPSPLRREGRKSAWRIAAVVVLMLLAGCVGVGGGMTCTKANGRGSCSGSLEKLSGANTLRFDMRDLAAGNGLHMQITVSVKTGAVTVTFVDQAGQTISKEVSREMPLTLEGMVSSSAEVILSSTHGISTGVEYAAEFTG